jgi:iron complex outermembrane recepter protein
MAREQHASVEVVRHRAELRAALQRDVEGVAGAALAAAAFDARLGGGTLLEAEIEASRQSQPSTPGFSLLGARLPDANDTDPRTNLNNQSWSLPVVMAGRTGSLRLTHTLADSESRHIDLVVHAMRQRLDSDDRIAFPFGCSAENAFDRYCSDGSFDYYDFRSDGERRTSDALDVSLQGRAQLGAMTHHFNAGAMSRASAGRLSTSSAPAASTAARSWPPTRH